MLQDLDSTLKELLLRELPSSVRSYFDESESINFDSPDESKFGSRTINLFLYDVRENVELRSTVGVIERQNSGMITTVPPPVFVDCSYIITVWLKEQPRNPSNEHMFLGEVMKVLLRYPKIPTHFFQGSLRDRDQPIRTSVLRPGQLQNMGDFWQAIGSKPKAALHYTVTIAVPVHEPVEAGMPVTEKIIGIKAGADIPADRLQLSNGT